MGYAEELDPTSNIVRPTITRYGFKSDPRNIEPAKVAAANVVAEFTMQNKLILAGLTNIDLDLIPVRKVVKELDDHIVPSGDVRICLLELRSRALEQVPPDELKAIGYAGLAACSPQMIDNIENGLYDERLENSFTLKNSPDYTAEICGNGG